MKTALFLMLAISMANVAHAKDCKENALGAALQAEALLENAIGFSKPIDARLESSHNGEQIWKAAIVGNNGTPVTYTVKLNNACEPIEEPVRDR